MQFRYLKNTIPPLTSANDPSSQGELEKLNELMGDYYNDPRMTEYYDWAHSNNETWSEYSDHAILWKICSKDDHVLDVGCGSGHAATNLQHCDVSYTGIDWSQKQVEENSKKFQNNSTFKAASLYEMPFEDNTFDVVFSLFVLEHCVWPDKLLNEMARVVKPSGTVFILCPHYRPFGRIPSFSYGRHIMPLKEKIQSNLWFDAIRHLWLRNIWYPLVLKKFSGSFLINLEPSCLRGKYYTDNDAVYLTCEKEVTTFMVKNGFEKITHHYKSNKNVSRKNGFLLGIYKKQKIKK